MVFGACGVAAAQDPAATTPAVTAPPAAPAQAELASAVVTRRGARMTVRARYRVPASVAGTVPVAWRALAGSRSARGLAPAGGGVRLAQVSGGVVAITITARMGAAIDRSGGFCLAPDWSALGLAPIDTACMDGSRVPRRSLTARVPEVTVFGDSVGAAFEWVPGTKEAMARGLSARFDLRTCRRLVAAPCPPNPPSVLSSIRSLPGSLGDIVVMNVGYNDWAATYDVPRVLRALRARGVDRVVWVLLRPTQGSYVSINGMIQRAARRSRDVQVADWGRAAAGSWFAPDGVHLTVSGGWGLARFLRREVREAVAVLRQPAR